MKEYMKTHILAQAKIEEFKSGENPISLLLNSSDKKGFAEVGEAIVKAGDSFDPEKDLMKMVSVLVSTGKNRNDDVFLPEELINVRFSGANKPLNIEHNSDHIIGHMTRSFLTDKDGKEIDDLESLPEDFDVTNEAVVYAFVKPDVADTIRKLAASNQLFVSVEMWFKDYDFLVNSKVIKRNQTTAFLSKCLRCNGGDGKYKGEEVGRVLRNALIGGIGVVEKPANLESVIKSVATLRSEGSRDVEVYSEQAIAKNIIGDLSPKSPENKIDREEPDMKELLEEMAATVTAATEKAVKEALANEKSEDSSASDATPKEVKGSEQEASTSSDDRVEKLVASVEKLTEQNSKLVETIEASQERIDSLELDRTLASRQASLEEIGLSGKQLQTWLTRAADMTEADFREWATDFAELFNEKNLRSEASENEESGEDAEGNTDAGTSDEEGSEGDSTEDADNVDASENDGNEDVIDMDKLEANDDINPGGGDSQGATVEDRMEQAIAKRLALRNKRWSKLTKKDEEE